MNHGTRRLSAVLAAGLLAACGAGGGDLDHPTTLDALRAEAARWDLPAANARALAEACPPAAPPTAPSC